MHVDNDPMLPGITEPLSIALPMKRKHERAPRGANSTIMACRRGTRCEGFDDHLPAWIEKIAWRHARRPILLLTEAKPWSLSLPFRKERHGRLSRRIDTRE